MKPSAEGQKGRILRVLGVSFALLALIAGGYGIWRLWRQKVALQGLAASLEQNLKSTQDQLAGREKDNADLNEALQNERAKNDQFASQIRDISGTVGTLQKLSQTDPELLKKYSKVYFLNENYIPPHVVDIDPTYDFEKGRTQQILVEVWPFLQRMIQSAEQNGINLRIVSAYRSFFEQYNLKTGYRVTYGSGANKFSADQGYSEHQLATTVDFTSTEINSAFTKFDTTKAYEWLNNNAYRYGFTLSYPKGNDYYVYEPWHWRFVGIDLATKLHDENKHFYDLTQREIDQYLISIFNQ